MVALVRNNIIVSHRDQIEVPAAGTLPPQMQGLFRVDTVRPNPSHTRVLCMRITDPEGAVQ